MTALIVKNSKIKKSEYKTFNFGIPKYYSHRYKMVTCPNAKDCIGGCFAGQNAFTWPQVQNAYENRLGATLRDDFPEVMIEEIIWKQADRIRIHDSGDFYSREYFHKWLLIAESLPHVEFYFYTKEVSMVKSTQLPDNVTVIFSFGGKEDHLIDRENDRFSDVFLTEEEIEAAGYANASHQDDIALGPNKKIGLVYHGAKSKKYCTI